MVGHGIEGDVSTGSASGEIEFIEVGVGKLVFGKKLDVFGDRKTDSGHGLNTESTEFVFLETRLVGEFHLYVRNGYPQSEAQIRLNPSEETFAIGRPEKKAVEGIGRQIIEPVGAIKIVESIRNWLGIIDRCPVPGAGHVDGAAFVEIYFGMEELQPKAPRRLAIQKIGQTATIVEW